MICYNQFSRIIIDYYIRVKNILIKMMIAFQYINKLLRRYWRKERFCRALKLKFCPRITKTACFLAVLFKLNFKRILNWSLVTKIFNKKSCKIMRKQMSNQISIKKKFLPSCVKVSKRNGQRYISGYFSLLI